MKSHGSKAGCWTAAIQVTLILVTESYFLFKLQEKINHQGSCYKVTFHCPKSPLPIEEVTLSLPSPAFLSVTSSSVTVNSEHQHTKNWLKLVEGEFSSAGLQCMFKHRLILASQNNSILDCMLYFLMPSNRKYEAIYWSLSKRCCQYALTKRKGFLGPTSRSVISVDYLEIQLQVHTSEQWTPLHLRSLFHNGLSPADLTSVALMPHCSFFPPAEPWKSKTATKE